MGSGGRGSEKKSWNIGKSPWCRRKSEREELGEGSERHNVLKGLGRRKETLEAALEWRAPKVKNQTMVTGNKREKNGCGGPLHVLAQEKKNRGHARSRAKHP